MKILFFGSTSDSVIIVKALAHLPDHEIVAAVTQPPRPIGRNQTITPTPVALWAQEYSIPVLSFPSNKEKPWLYEDESTVVDTLAPFQADLLVSASYGQLIPTKTITDAPYHGLNVHPSILPRWRGADPVPWAIMTGDHQTGVTVVTLSADFDQGKIIAQKKVAITPEDTSDPLRTKLFELGAALLCDVIPEYVSGEIKGILQDKSQTPYARRLTRDDGFVPRETLQTAQTDANVAAGLDRKFRALLPWPGLWTMLPIPAKRLKILACKLTTNGLTLETVQLEGKNPVSYDEFARAYLTPPKSP